MVIKNTEPYYDGLYDNNTLVSKAYVHAENSKQDLAIADKTSKACVNTENSKQNIAIADNTNKSHVDNVDRALLNNIDGIKEALREVSIKSNQGLDKKLSIHGGNSKTVDLDVGNNKVINIAPGSTNNDAVNYEQFTTKANKNEPLLLGGSNKMAVDLDINNNKIINLTTDSHSMLSATNIRYINQVKRDMIITMTDSFNKKINKSHISGSTSKKNVF